jgi:hypothetical protein
MKRAQTWSYDGSGRAVHANIFSQQTKSTETVGIGESQISENNLVSAVGAICGLKTEH